MLIFVASMLIKRTPIFADVCYLLFGLKEKKGHVFESETDTEVIAKLILHLYTNHKDLNFRELVEAVVQQLVRELLF